LINRMIAVRQPEVRNSALAISDRFGGRTSAVFRAGEEQKK